MCCKLRPGAYSGKSKHNCLTCIVGFEQLKSSKSQEAKPSYTHNHINRQSGNCDRACQKRCSVIELSESMLSSVLISGAASC
jgi:hypothetical protein